MPQSWDMGQILRFFYFPSGGRHAEDFYARKIQRLRPGLNPQTWVPEASMLTTRPPKPSGHVVKVHPFSFFYDWTALVGLDLLTGEVWRSHSDTPHSVGLILTSARSVVEASNTKYSQETVIHVTGGIRTRNPQ